MHSCTESSISVVQAVYLVRWDHRGLARWSGPELCEKGLVTIITRPFSQISNFGMAINRPDLCVDRDHGRARFSEESSQKDPETTECMSAGTPS